METEQEQSTMNMDDMVLISVDDHISEPPDLFDRILSGRELLTAPKLRTTNQGTDYWEYQGMKLPTVGLNAVVGRVPEEYGVEPTAMSQLRPGNYDVHARIDDMNVNGIAASLNFGSCVTMDGRVLLNAKDKDLALIHLRAWNDWHLYEWCNAYPGRFIPCAILPVWNMSGWACPASTTNIGRPSSRRSSTTTWRSACTSVPAIPRRWRA
jgi:hypothetical protein